jgi:hypothetical protein
MWTKVAARPVAGGNTGTRGLVEREPELRLVARAKVRPEDVERVSRAFGSS